MSENPSDDLSDWLGTLGLGQYLEAFRGNDVTLALLPQLTSEDLREIGVASVGHRRLILTAAAQLDLSAASPAADSVTAADGPEQRIVTALFCDLVGSTRLSAELDPEDYRDMIASFRAEVAAALSEQNGQVSRFLGDGIVVFFGLAGGQDHAAETAVAAALGILDRIRALPLVNGARLQVRIGLATGLSLIDSADGSTVRRQDTVVGEIPNLAARLQAAAEPNSILISQSTRDRLGDLFALQDRGKLTLKGVAGSQRAWVVLGHAEVASRFDALRLGKGHAPLVGRGRELDLLLERTKASGSDGQRRMTLVTGESGIGKSRLVREALAQAGHDLGHLPVLQCTPYHTGTPFLPFSRFIGRQLGKFEGAEERSSRIGALLAEFDLDGAQNCDLLLGLLSDTRTDWTADPASTARARTQREDLVELLTRLVDRIGARKGVLLLEDVHWLDPSSAEVLNRLFAADAPHGWHLVVTMRTCPHPDWCLSAGAEILALDRLPPADFETLIRAVAAAQAPGVEVSAAQVAEIAQRCDGSPVFAEELTRFRLDALSNPQAPQDQALPATLADSLLARLDRLAEGRRLAQTASAIGSEFPVAILHAVSGMPAAASATGVEALIDAGVLQRAHGPFGPAVGFRHMLLQEAAYLTLLRRDRVQLHARIAETLIGDFPDLAEALPQVVAHQLSRSGQAARAARYWRAAGSLATRRSAYAEAITHLRKALEDLALVADRGTDLQRLELDIRLELVSALTAAQGFGSPAVRQEMPRLEALGLALQSGDRLIPLLVSKWVFLGSTGEIVASLEVARKISELAASGDEVHQLLGHRAQGTSLLFAGQLAEAKERLSAFFALYDPVRHGEGLSHHGASNHAAMSAVGLAEVAVLHGDDLGADHWGQVARHHAEASGLSHDLCNVTLFTGCVIPALQGRFDLTGSATERLQHLADDHGLPLWSGYADLFRGLALMAAGRRAEGLRVSRQGIERVLHAAAFLRFTLLFHADACFQSGLVDDAIESLSGSGIGIESPETCPETWLTAERLRLEAVAAQRKGQPEAGARFLARARSVAKRQGARLFLARIAATEGVGA